MKKNIENKKKKERIDLLRSKRNEEKEKEKNGEVLFKK